MSDDKDLKKQRDRFLAFAFASADLLLEISETGTISFISGATKALIGEDQKSLEGRNWLDLFSAYEQARILDLQNSALPGMRCGPLLINLNQSMSDRKGILTGIKMPNSPNFYITISLSNELMEKIAYNDDDDFDDSLYNKTRFLDEAEKIFEFARTTTKEADFSVFEIERTKTIPEENWAEMMGEMAKYIREQALDGKIAAEITDNRIGLIHDSSVDVSGLHEHLKSLTEGKDPDGELEVKSKNIKTDVNELGAKEAARALAYVFSELEDESKSLEEEPDGLNEGLEKYVKSNEVKIGKLKDSIDRVSFAIYYQPAVAFSNLDEVDHYEMLCRFDEGNSREWIMFGEDVGLAPDIDLAMLDRVINFINFKAGGTRTKYTMNLSRFSLEDEKFHEALVEHLDKDKNKPLNQRLTFELTGLNHIENKEQLSTCINELTGRGFTLTLDDFEPKNSALLDEFEFAYAKIERNYVTKMLSSENDANTVKNLVQMGKDKKVKVFAKSVETQEQIDMLKKLGVEYAQGFFYGKPESKPGYIPPKD